MRTNSEFLSKLLYGKKLYHAFLQPCPPWLRFFSSLNLSQTLEKKKKSNRALRLLDIINPKASVARTHRQRHLQLIENFLAPSLEQLSSQELSIGSALSCSSSSEEIINLFGQGLESNPVYTQSCNERLMNDATVLSHAVSLCGSMCDLHGGVQYHCLALRTGFVANIYIGSSLIHLYGKCNELDNAYQVFVEMPIKNVVSWTSIIAAFAQDWQVDVCLDLFHRMRNSILKPNDFTFTSLLSACMGSGALGQGRSIHCQTIQMGFYSYIHISNALISMYCKCGAVDHALFIFRSIDRKDTVSWNSMITGYAQHGLAFQAIDLFKEMKKQSVKTDAISFLGVLSSCRHAGLVKEGWLYLNSMVENGVQPELDHYSCVIDLLGRAGLLEEALEVIQKMPINPNAVIWGSLLSSCRFHGNIWFGIQAAENRLLLEPSCAATHVQLAHLYASVGCWDHVARVRKLMKDKGLKTSPGCSWIEVKNEVCKFRAEDMSNARMVEIISVLDSLADHMGALSHDPEILQEEMGFMFYFQ
ncbi:pentatricopeptide repeat-containing protein At2g37320 [Ziziphus jujuba]|uniref:Pentatricopeptide repeat-containing protein At2g37320 n=1 Tax=Ziziphus jujuba TaxID=326968 RepID=A0A6P4AUB9_ZIZJJ|nr:pentatricopeptide repeat-containing protein At2g37320 [Ziziphus jujuba]